MGLDHGEWTRNMLPPEKIGAGALRSPTTATWASESDGFMTGTEGSVVYELGDDPSTSGTVRFDWNNPYIGSNGYRVGLSGALAGKLRADYEGGSGDNATVSFWLKPM